MLCFTPNEKYHLNGRGWVYSGYPDPSFVGLTEQDVIGKPILMDSATVECAGIERFVNQHDRPFRDNELIGILVKDAH